MDKITRIHIARIPYEISVSGQELLQRYLRDIRATLDEALADDVMADVETRVTEILAERGIKKNDVITSTDIKAAQDRLGAPEQFGDDESPHKKSHPAEPSRPRKLLRDLDNAYIGGVAAGLASYFGIDPIVVRLAFVALAFVSGVGIVAYILFWLLVPAAKSNSDKLRMVGQAVTIDTLKRYRSNIERELAQNPNPAQKTVLLAGRVVLFGIKMLISLIVGGVILALLSFIAASLSLSAVEPFHSLVDSYKLDYVMLALAWLTALSLIGLLVTALAAVWSRRRELKYGILVCLPLLAVVLVAGLGVGVQVANHFGNEYGNGKTIKLLAVTSITPEVVPAKLSIEGDSDLAVTYIVTSAPLHAAYQAAPGLSGRPNIKLTSAGGTLDVSAAGLARLAPTCFGNLCRSLYLPLRVTIYGPALSAVDDAAGAHLSITGADFGDTLTLNAENGADVTLDNDTAGNFKLSASGGARIHAGSSNVSRADLSAGADSQIEAPLASSLSATLPAACRIGNQVLFLSNQPIQTTINGILQTPTLLAANSCIQPLETAPPAPPAS